MVSDIQDKVGQTRHEIEQMKEKIRVMKEEVNDTSLKDFTADLSSLPKGERIRVRRTLKGHLAKIYAMHWAEDKVHLVSASQDGKLLVWDGLTTNKVHLFP